ncbi:outer membrane protein assembly factor BamB [Algibacillus agarilyticus]|uniref:outer membrane protein assembly factor BamB n=1 Tax=Algibacillus agarilyticus TaxID=2234133 RepID=UPI000DD08F26|nr:outer membrane protein assembly factor BamB [Algibacillus agarilyticus]
MIKHCGLKPLLLISAIVLGVQGCASNDDIADLPAPLPVLSAPLPLTEQWDFSVSSGIDSFYSSLSPTVAYDKVFVASRSGDIYALDKSTGEQVWRADVRKVPNSFWQIFGFDDEKIARVAGGLVASYDHVYLGTEDGEVIGLNQATGEIAWRVKVKGEVVSSPVAEAGKVYVHTTAGHIFALDAQTGEQKWHTESEVPVLTLRGSSAPVFANGGIMVGGANGKLSVYLAETGQLAWEEIVATPSGSTELERVVDIDSTPLVIGRLIYSLSYGGTLTAMDYRNGSIVWKREYAGYVNMTTLGNDLYIVDKKSNILAVDRRNGVEKWSSAELINRQLTAPIIHDGRIAVGDFEGYVHWLNTETGAIEAQLLIDREGLYSPGVIDDKTLIVQASSGEISAVAFDENASSKPMNQTTGFVAPERYIFESRSF